MLEGYVIIDRLVAHDFGIGYIDICGKATTYEEVLEAFAKEKESLLQSIPDCNKTIIRDEEDIFCIQYDNFGCRYIKIINLY